MYREEENLDVTDGYFKILCFLSLKMCFVKKNYP
jgi:hypothetical protein